MSDDDPTPQGAADDEDTRILWEATARADAFMADLARGRDTGGDLEALLGFLREVVLARITDEDRHILPELRQQPGNADLLDNLARQHLQLRDDIEDLAAAAQSQPAREARAQLIRRLLRHLEDHIAAEASLLHTAHITRDWVAASHWFPLTEGPVIDMDALRDDQADGAVLNRLTWLRPGEHVMLRGSRDPHPLWLRLQQRDPGGYSWEATQDSASASWSVRVLRRDAA